jgi:hypothetical protein
LGRFLAFGFVLLVLAGIGMAIVAEETSGHMYALSFTPAYYWVVVALMGAGILRAMWGADSAHTRTRDGGTTWRRFARAVYDTTRVRVFRWAYFVAFSLTVFYPIFRCYFRVPYLFCHVCPRKCVFGFLRPYLVPAALIANLEKRWWCYHACPIGTLFDCQARVCTESSRVPTRWRAVALAVLAFTALAYFKIMWDLDHQPAAQFDWYTFFYNNTFGVSMAVITAAAALIILAYRRRRTFCETLCPVGTFSDLVLKLERSTSRKRSAAQPTAGSTSVEALEH